MTSRRSVRTALVALTLLALPVAVSRRVEGAIVERIVAVVGDRPILLSELRKRARPFLARIHSQPMSSAQQAAAESEMYKELLNRLIDDRLEEQAADKAKLQVTTDEVDRAMQNVAAQARVTTRELVNEAKRNGLSEQDYRDELRRQLLEGKLVQLRVRGRVRVTEQDARAAYGHWVKSLGADAPMDVRIIALRLPPTEDAARAKAAQAEELVKRARSGEDFCALVKEASEDNSTKDTCGSRGPQPSQAYLPPIAEAVRGLARGEVVGPIQVGNEAIVVAQVASEPTVPPFEQVRDNMLERAYSEVMDRQRRAWLEELRRGAYVDVRL